MEKDLHIDRFIHVGFIWRLEREKGADILLRTLERVSNDIELRNTFIFSIIGEGSYLEEFAQLKTHSNIHIHLYWKIPHDEVIEKLKTWEILCMPSRFLETFGLVALEAVTHGVHVCGPKQWWMSDFVSSDMAIDMTHPVEDILKILHRAKEIKKNKFPLDRYTLSNWKKGLRNIIKKRKNILVLHDYKETLWWAEIYVDFLEKELKWLWCKVARYWHKWKLSRLKRITLMMLTPIAFWRYFEVKNAIKKSKPELIWLNSILRYIWPWWIYAVKKSWTPYVITHHDLWLISPRPSHVESEYEISYSLKFTSFFHKSINPIEWILRASKYILIRIIWRLLSHVEAHIVPADFLKNVLKKTTDSIVIVFPHTLINASSISEKESEIGEI